MAIPVFNTGQVLTAAHVNDWLRGPLWVRKTSDQALANDTSVQDDSELVISVDSNVRYHAEFFVLYRSSPGNDMKINLRVPSGAIFRGYAFRPMGGAADTFDHDLNTWNEDTQLAAGGIGSATDIVFMIRGLLSIAGTAGTVAVQWAQQAGGATATTVRAGSFIALQRVD